MGNILENSLDFINLTEVEIKMLNPLVWAYIGDAVYEMYVRSYIISRCRKTSNDLHRESIKYVKAAAQSRHLDIIMEFLTEEEQDVVRRGRNTKTSHVPKNADMMDYRRATAFEALIGYLYLLKRYDRLGEVIRMVLKDNE